MLSLVRIQSSRQSWSRQQNICSAVFLLSLRCVQAHRKTTKNLARHACHLLFLCGGWYSLIYGCGDRVISIARLSACALFWLSPRGRSFLLLPSNPVIPTKPSEARRCRKTSFCFLCLVASLLADNGVKNKSRLRSNLLAEIGFKCPRGKRGWKGVKRSRRSLRSSQSSHPDKSEQTAEIQSLRYKEPAKSLFSHFFCCYRYFFYLCHRTRSHPRRVIS